MPYLAFLDVMSHNNSKHYDFTRNIDWSAEEEERTLAIVVYSNWKQFMIIFMLSSQLIIQYIKPIAPRNPPNLGII